MKKVRIIYHHEPEGWSAESPDCPGYSASGRTIDEVKGLIREGIPFYFDDAAVEIVSEEIVESSPDAA